MHTENSPMLLDDVKDERYHKTDEYALAKAVDEGVIAGAGLDVFVRAQAAQGKPLMGICLGMQLLFEKSYEYGEHRGLGLIPGVIRPIEGVIPKELKIPHIGWNALHFKKNDCPLFKYIKENDCVYFVHSYFAEDCDESVAATTEYGKELTAAVAYKNIYGCQFHPEKSGEVGLNILRAFCETEAE